MIVRRRRIHASPENIRRGVTVFREQLLPRIRREPGFRGAVVLTDADRGVAQTVTLWADRDAERANWAAGQQRRDDAMRDLNFDVVDTEVFDEVIRERGASLPAQSADADADAPAAFTRHNSGQVDPARLDDAVQLARERIVPLVRDLPGFMSLVMAVNRDNGRLYLSTVWDSRENRASSQAAVTPLRSEIGQALGSQFTVEEYDLAVAEVAEVAAGT